MPIPTLNVSLPPTQRWPDLLRRNPDLLDDWIKMLNDFEAQSDHIISSTVTTWRGKGAAWLHRVLTPESSLFQDELAGISRYLGVNIGVLLAAQLVYDASTAGQIDAVCGCTSMSMLHNGRPWHGRLLDWSWPSSIRDTVRIIKVVGGRGGDYFAEHIPGTTGFVGAYNSAYAVNLNQAPTSKLRPTALPALWWFRNAVDRGSFLVENLSLIRGGMTDALIHVTTSSCRTKRIYYSGGRPEVRSSGLTKAPTVLTNTLTHKSAGEDSDAREWSTWRESAIAASRKRIPSRRLAEAECDDTIHRWEVQL